MKTGAEIGGTLHELGWLRATRSWDRLGRFCPAAFRGSRALATTPYGQSRLYSEIQVDMGDPNSMSSS